MLKVVSGLPEKARDFFVTILPIKNYRTGENPMGFVLIIL